MTLDAESLKKMMRVWVSGVTVVTAAQDAQRAGVTASSFTSISLEPPLVLVSLQHFIHTYKLIEETKHFAISILRDDQAHLSAQFAGFVTLPEGADRFYNVPLMTSITGAPILAEAAAWVDCRVYTVHEAGLSRLVIGEVVAAGSQEGARPLAYHNRGYYDIVPQAAP